MSALESQGQARDGLQEIIPEIVRVPGWEQFPWLRAGFSARGGGSSHVYGPGEQNLGWTAEDDSTTVAANRARFVHAIAGFELSALVTVRQIHGSAVRDLEVEETPFMTEDGKARFEADGAISRRPGRVLAILTADCVPVLVADKRTHAVGAFHAGWRGTLARIVEIGIGHMKSRYGSRPEDLVAAIGPCIHACCFEVGEEVRSAFVEKDAAAAAFFSQTDERGAWHMDLVAANRNQLLGAGLDQAQITLVSECTACSREQNGRRKYFSHRAERGVTGRMLSAIAALS